MGMSGAQRRELIARGHQLKAAVAIVGDAVGEGALAHIRDLLKKRELLKVRIKAEDAATCDRTAAELARGVPCEVVSRVGRIVLLWSAEQTQEHGAAGEKKTPGP
jgi:RNA-binding protein YhbY